MWVSTTLSKHFIMIGVRATVVIHAGRWTLLGEGDNGCGLEAEWSNAQDKGKVEDGVESISQVVATCSESLPREVVWSIYLVGVDLSQGPVYLV